MTPFAELVPDGDQLVIDWPVIEESFDWFARLRACPQDPWFHAEGDVNIHTRMVCEALIADPRWRELDAEARASVFWAALLHDVAKPDCTRREPGGRVVSPGHSRRGQIMARRILWRLGATFSQREQICHMITHHQVPFYLLEREQPERRVHLISLQTRCDLLALLADADARGRVCSDRARLIDNVELFRELCRDHQCYDAPKRFASAHSRFLYFRKSERAPDYEAFDDWPGQAVLMSGLPATGKDTWLSANPSGAEIISLDDLRAELGVHADEKQGKVVAAARERARRALRVQRPIVWNATNVSRAIRSSLIDLVASYRAKVTIVYLETGRSELERRNCSRMRPVPERALSRMLDRWEVPDLTECHALTVAIT
jgi:predicted kinase